MPEFVVRRIIVTVEETAHDGGPPLAAPRRRAAAMALVANPFAGRHEPVLEPHMEALKPLAETLVDRLAAALGGFEGVDGYGKGSIIGAAGELEHGALWHVPGGYAMRGRLGRALAIVPSATKVAGVGARLDVPLGHINAAYVRSHFDAMEVGAPDGPKPDEILFVLAMACGGRPHARMGGLTADAIRGEDGLR